MARFASHTKILMEGGLCPESIDSLPMIGEGLGSGSKPSWQRGLGDR